jgi:hypothetical protein
MATTKPAVSAFVLECQRAMDEYLKMRREGVPREDAIRGIELILREHFRESNGFDRVMDDYQSRAAKNHA